MAIISANRRFLHTFCLLGFLLLAGNALAVQPQFTIAVTPASLSVQQGSQATSTVTTSISGGFNKPISFVASGAPAGATVSFTPKLFLAPGAGRSTMTIAVPSNAARGSYRILIIGVGGGMQRTTAVALSVTAAPSFTLSASTAALSVQQGNQGTATLTTAISGGFKKAITFAASGAPAGATVSFAPSMILAPGAGRSTMTVTVPRSAAPATYRITVTGSGGGLQKTAAVALSVTAAPSFTLSASTAALSVQQGNQGTATLTTAISGGFNKPITFAASGAPAGASSELYSEHDSGSRRWPIHYHRYGAALRRPRDLPHHRHRQRRRLAENRHRRAGRDRRAQLHALRLDRCP